MDRNSLGNQQITKIIDQLNQAKTQTKSGKMLFVKKKIVFVSKAFEWNKYMKTTYSQNKWKQKFRQLRSDVKTMI